MSTVSTILVAFVSAFLGAGSKLGIDSWTRISESRSLAAILAAEISATLSSIKQRRYVEISQETLNVLKSGRDVKLVDFVPTSETLDVAYKAAVTELKLGMVGPELAALVTKFFRQLNGIVGDIKRYGTNSASASIAEKKSYLEDALRVSEETLADGTLAVQKLTEFAKRGGLHHMIDAIFDTVRDTKAASDSRGANAR